MFMRVVYFTLKSIPLAREIKTITSVITKSSHFDSLKSIPLAREIKTLLMF